MLPYVIADTIDEMTLMARIVRSLRPIQQLRPLMIQVAERHGFTPRDLVAHNRTPKLVLARQEFFYLAMTLTDKSAPAIGLIADRDHTTVMYGAARHALRHGLEIPRRDEDRWCGSYDWKKLQKFMPPRLTYQPVAA